MSSCITTNVGISGHVEVGIYRGDRLTATLTGKNRVTDAWMTAILTSLSTGSMSLIPTQISFGTNGFPALSSDTAPLTNAYTKPLINVEAVNENGDVYIRWALDHVEGNDLNASGDGVIREFGLLAADGTLLARKVLTTGINKTAAINLRGAWIISMLAV